MEKMDWIRPITFNRLWNISADIFFLTVAALSQISTRVKRFISYTIKMILLIHSIMKAAHVNNDPVSCQQVGLPAFK